MWLLKLEILPQGITLNCRANQSILSVIQESGLPFYSPCGGKGICGKCKVKIKKGNVSELSDVERRLLNETEIQDGVRLACQTRIVSGKTIVEIISNDTGTNDFAKFSKRWGNLPPKQKRLFTKSFNIDRNLSINENFKALGMEIHESSELGLFRTIAERLGKESGPKVQFTGVFIDGKLSSIVENKDNVYSIALDVGTSSVGACLINSHGEVTKTGSKINSQLKYGADIVTRINSSMTKNGLHALNREIIYTINELITELIDPELVYFVGIAGNTCMLHFLMGIPPSRLGFSPFVPEFTHLRIHDAISLGFKVNSNARLYLLPILSKFVGSDALAVASVCRLDENYPCLVLDCGTNAEILLSTKDAVFFTSVPAGPAFEGFNISSGMIASPGAINKVYINGDIHYDVLGGQEAKGICGSGLIDLIYVLKNQGLIDRSGRFKKSGSRILENRFRNVNGTLKFVITDSNLGNKEISLTQEDVRKLQLAKAAVRTGIDMLLQKAKLTINDVSKIFLAGTFGNHIDLRSAQGIGLLPEGEISSKVDFIGNAVCYGVAELMIDCDRYSHMYKILKKARYVDLRSDVRFQELLVENMYL